MIWVQVKEFLQPVVSTWKQWTAPGSAVQQAMWTTNRYLEQREPRERFLLAGSVLLVTGTIWYQGFFAPGAKALDAATGAVTAQEASNEALMQRIDELKLLQQMAENPDQPVIEQIADAQIDLERLNDRLIEEGLSFIAPAPMSEVIAALERVLENENSAQLLYFERRNGERLFQSDGDSSSTWSISRSQIDFAFESDYRGAISYLRAVEQLPFKFAWERLDFQVQSHPVARVEVTLSAFAPEELP